MAPKRKPEPNLDLTCPIGLDLIEDEVTLPCGHYMCQVCWEKSGKNRCPICRLNVDLTWVPTPNKVLRKKLCTIKRKARCGQSFTLTALRLHQSECRECILGKLRDTVMENFALERRILILERKVVDANTMIQMMRYAQRTV